VLVEIENNVLWLKFVLAGMEPEMVTKRSILASLSWGTLGLVVLILLPLAFMYPLLPLVIGLIYPGYFCETRVRGSVTVMSGYEFEFSETACDVIAKDDAITVFVTKSGVGAKTALFKYDPGSDELPQVTSVDAHTVRIAIGSISSVFFRKNEFGDLSITYAIGHIDYPE
jgi:hypothetical protein